MRPVRLEAEGFTCYRERQQPLDFSGLSLFAIAGPTGAGKSSILDTMLYALYGEVPRIGKQGIGEFIAHGRDAMSVSLDFAVRGTAYRVVRRVKRGKKNLATQATLAELTPGGERSVADGVKPVNDAVEKLLGLDFDAFTQTVILPQGEFAKFLKADPKDQRGILQHLLRHDVFTRMREEAERRRLGFDRDLRGVEGQLQAFADATPEALISKQSERDGAADTLARLAAARDRLGAELEQVRARRALTVQVVQLRERRAALDVEAPAVQARRDELLAARRADLVMPRIEAAAESDRQLARAREAQQQAASAAVAATAALTRAEQAVATAGEAAKACPALQERITAIDKITGDLARRVALDTALTALTASLSSARRQVDAAASKADAARRDLERASAAMAAANEALAAVDYNADEQQRIEQLASTVAQVRTIDDELARLGARHTKCGADADAAGQRLAESERAFDRAERAHRNAVANETDAARGLEEARAQHQAAALRMHLHEGDACPVCLQTVGSIPDVPAVPELAVLEKARAAATTRATAAQKAVHASAEQRADARARVDTTRHALELVAAEIEQKRTARAPLIASIAAACAGAAPGASEDELCGVVDARRTALQSARAAHERAAGAARAAESAHAAATLIMVTAQADHRAAAQALEHLEASERAQRDELAAVCQRVAAVSAHPDPSQERAELAAERARLEHVLQAAQQELGAARVASASARERATAASSTVVDAEQSVRAARTALDSALAEGEFSSAAAANAAVIDAAGQAARAQRVSQHEAERAAVLAGLAAIEPQVAAREVSADQLTFAERAWTDAFEAWRQAERTCDALIVECERLAGQVETRARLTAEHDALQRTLDLHARMATDLQGNGFQEYLLEEAFHALVAGASVRMRQMSNRYTLAWDGGDFFVVDHDNAGERRRAETLSGGETFMASLCLALQLSDEVLKTSGALQMDSLFIDEGFGTLDADALSEVTDAMEALRHDGSRLIGVISHRPELTDRLPGCIRVVKGAGESRWVLERIG